MSESGPAPTLHPAARRGSEERARLVRSIFAGVAQRYDLVNRVTSFGVDTAWRRRVARALDLGPGRRCLDVCCGTGDLGLAIASRGGADVVGVDFCGEMLVAGREKRPVRGTFTAVSGDAVRLPVADATIDAACVAFGLRNVVAPEAALEEMCRVLRPGGWVAVLEFGRPRLAGVRGAYRLYSEKVLPFVGDAISGRPGTYRYLPQTIGTWPEPEETRDMMVRAGFSDVRFSRLSFGIAILHVGQRPDTPDRGVSSSC